MLWLLAALIPFIPADGTSVDAAAKPLAIPAAGHTLFGVQLDWVKDSPASYRQRAGFTPAQYGDFLIYPLSAPDKQKLTTEAAAAHAAGADFFLTLEPMGGLSTVTVANADDLASTLAASNSTGARFYVRFAQEMNGGWYPWGQQPAAYVKAFRIVANAVHRKALGNAMVWSPNYGGGYPFTGGADVARPGTADFKALDTNHDGKLTMADDMYTPFYPGDSYVDWVGMTLYWFGYKWPWGANIVPDVGRFVGSITGTYDGAEDERSVPDFYQAFAVAHHKPMAISETGALYNQSKPIGASELAVKSAWMDQALSPANAVRFPQLKMENWFEYQKQAQEDYGVIDWRATASPTVAAALGQHLKASPGQFLFGQTRTTK